MLIDFSGIDDSASNYNWDMEKPFNIRVTDVSPMAPHTTGSGAECLKFKVTFECTQDGQTSSFRTFKDFYTSPGAMKFIQHLARCLGESGSGIETEHLYGKTGKVWMEYPIKDGVKSEFRRIKEKGGFIPKKVDVEEVEVPF